MPPVASVYSGSTVTGTDPVGPSFYINAQNIAADGQLYIVGGSDLSGILHSTVETATSNAPSDSAIHVYNTAEIVLEGGYATTSSDVPVIFVTNISTDIPYVILRSATLVTAGSSAFTIQASTVTSDVPFYFQNHGAVTANNPPEADVIPLFGAVNSDTTMFNGYNWNGSVVI